MLWVLSAINKVAFAGVYKDHDALIAVSGDLAVPPVIFDHCIGCIVAADRVAGQCHDVSLSIIMLTKCSSYDSIVITSTLTVTIHDLNSKITTLIEKKNIQNHRSHSNNSTGSHLESRRDVHSASAESIILLRSNFHQCDVMVPTADWVNA